MSPSALGHTVTQAKVLVTQVWCFFLYVVWRLCVYVFYTSWWFLPLNELFEYV